MATLIAGVDVPPLSASVDAIPPVGSSLAAFINALDGRTVDSCGGFPIGQCTALACLWARNLGLGTPCGSCASPHHCDGACWAGGSYPGWTWIANGPANVPSAGDIVAYHADCDGIGVNGHVGVFVSGTSSSFTGFDQNWNGAYCRLIEHTYACVAGWQHPTSQQGSSSPPPSSNPVSCPPGLMQVGSFCYPEISAYPGPLVPIALVLGGFTVAAAWAYQNRPGFRAEVQGLEARAGSLERRAGGILRPSRR